MTEEEYIKRYDEIWDQRPKQKYNDIYYSYKQINGRYIKYGDDYINRGGADLTRAYLKDLGYDEKTIEFLFNKMRKANKTLGDV